MKFIPIINLNLGIANLNYQDERNLYKVILEVFEESSFDKVEFSFASSSIFDHLDLIIDSYLFRSGKVCFGSLVALEILQKLMPLLNLKLEQKLEIYAPAFDDEIYEYIHAQGLNQVIDYIPGISNKVEFNELISKNLSHQKIKIFPLSQNDTKGFLKALQAPYPELKSADLNKRIHDPELELAESYNLYQRSQQNSSIYLISSPREYQKIRREFLADKSKRLLLKANDINLDELVQEIKNYEPKQSLIITGFNRALIDYKYLDALGADFIATRVFRNIILDLLAGNISIINAKQLMQEELKSLALSYEKEFY